MEGLVGHTGSKLARRLAGRYYEPAAFAPVLLVFPDFASGFCRFRWFTLIFLTTVHCVFNGSYLRDPLSFNLSVTLLGHKSSTA